MEELPDISKWNFDKVKDMSVMFFNCISLLYLPGIYTWETYNVEDMSGLFANCISLTYIPDISKWKTNNVIFMGGMFYNCKKLLSLPDISGWNFNNTVDMSQMFFNCVSLSSTPDIKNKLKSKNNINKFFMFVNCPNNDSIPHLFKTNKINKNDVVEGVYNNFSELYLNIKDKEFCLNYQHLFSMAGDRLFIDYYNYLNKIINNYSSIYQKKNNVNKKCNKFKMKSYIMIYKIENYNKKVRILGKDFVKNNKNKGIIIYNNHKFSLQEFIIINDIKDIIKVKMILINNISNLSYMFKDCYSLFSFDEIENINDTFLKYSNFSEIYKYEDKTILPNKALSFNNIGCYTSFYMMFHNCFKITILPDLSNLNTDNVRNITRMFSNCESLYELPDISKWNTSNILTMSGLFCNSNKLEYIPDIYRWETNNLADISGMFCNCFSLKFLPNISSWNTINITDMSLFNLLIYR